MLITPARVAAGLLKRLDTVAAAFLVAIALTPVPARWVCAEASCRSVRDTVVFVAFTAVAFLGAAALLWRTTRPWWSRAIVLPLTVYLSIQSGAWFGRYGRWSVLRDDGTSCVVRAGASKAEVRRTCGVPTYWCEGPKFIESADRWNPLAITVCGFSGEVYRQRLVTYDCNGRVASVDGVAATGPDERPAGCLTWGRPADAR